MGNDGSVDGKEEQQPVFHLTDRDKEILAMRDEDYSLQTWDELKELISTKALEKLTRLPSQLRAYLAWSAETKQQYGSMTNFILKNRVCWSNYTLDPSGSPIFTDIHSAIPFADPRDYRILQNDWPYGLARGIVHVVVWLKVRLPVDDLSGDLTTEGRDMVEEFVGKAFEKGLGVEGKDQVIWFKNWTGLQSVRGVEHVHVLVRDVEMETLSGLLERPWEDRAVP